MPGRAYPVLVGEEALLALTGLVRELAPSGAALITDENVVEVAGQTAARLSEAGLEPARLVVPAGEGSKTLARYAEVLEFLEASRLDRGGLVVAVGGGTVGDLAGFAAATWLRGLRWLQVPTTLLAMVDSSVGGKTGVNTERTKNAVGAFWQPAAVVSDTRLLETLPDPEYRAAFAEVVKYAIAQDRDLARALPGLAAELFERRPRPLAEVVTTCVRLKAAVVTADERDERGRAILNYGHTAAHALEVASQYTVPHGRAVAFGLRAAALVALALGLCDAELVTVQDDLLALFGLPGPLPPVDPEQLLAAIPRDKKARGGEVDWVLPREVGRAETGCRVPPATVESVLRRILSR